MCGFAGFFTLSLLDTTIAERRLNNMGKMLSHRGPDDDGIWFSKNDGIGLTHRRLSIVDLSPAGHQPMISASGRYTIVFNGEIYNHQKIRTQLIEDGHLVVWKGGSDTETLLAGFDIWGIEETIKSSIGMFAFAVWDNQKKELTIGRDRLGEKPIYYGWQGNSFLFGSELKSIKHHPDFAKNISRKSLSLFLRHGYVPGPHSIYEGISKLKPGSILTISKNKLLPTINSYWNIGDCISSAKKTPFVGSSNDAIIQLESLLKEVISKQMLADVPLGAFLSGGVDSSLIVALMQAQSSRRIKTFSIGFNEKEFNEALYAKKVAEHLGTDHHEYYITAAEAISVIPLLPQLYDEPFADPSQIPTYLLAKLAKQYVTVSLSGDGGDELFGGYNRYISTNKYWNTVSKIPTGIKNIIHRGIESTKPQTLDKIFRPFDSFFNVPQIGNMIHKGLVLLKHNSIDDLYLAITSHHQMPNILLNETRIVTNYDAVNFKNKSDISNVERMMMLDLSSYLPDDILVKLDRASMGVSLESRVPFLDHRLVEFAWSLPIEMKLRNNIGKSVLREVLYKHVPKKLIDRPKMGFGIPIEQWLRGPLKIWASNLLCIDRLKKEGLFDGVKVNEVWNEHLEGRRNHSSILWNILMFQSWYELEQ